MIENVRFMNLHPLTYAVVIGAMFIALNSKQSLAIDLKYEELSAAIKSNSEAIDDQRNETRSIANDVVDAAKLTFDAMAARSVALDERNEERYKRSILNEQALLNTFAQVDANLTQINEKISRLSSDISESLSQEFQDRCLRSAWGERVLISTLSNQIRPDLIEKVKDKVIRLAQVTGVRIYYSFSEFCRRHVLYSNIDETYPDPIWTSYSELRGDLQALESPPLYNVASTALDE
jgi:chemotaxis regulatin CheY-phosphate phosphatase CheZ